MKFINLTTLFICMFFAVTQLKAQNDINSLWLENLEELSGTLEEETSSWNDELEDLSYLLQEPLNLNTATRVQLKLFPFLSDLQVENIQAYIYLHGQMRTIYELQLVEDMDKRTIELLLPFVSVQPVDETIKYPSLKNIVKYGRHELLTRFDVPFYRRKGYEEEYLGPPVYHSLRYSFRYGEYLQAGFSAEKDAGEPFFALHDSKGYDYYSVYFLLKTHGFVKAFSLGNYRLSFGQGLVLGNAFGMGKSFSLSTSDYHATGIRRHSSTDEYNYFRGVAATLRPAKRVEFSAFYSHRSLDGTLEDGNIVSIYKTGLHRSQKEADKANAFNMQIAGGNVSYDGSRFHAGITGIYYFFNHPYEPDYREYAKYNIRGNHFYNVGLDYRYRAGRFGWTGEAALGKNGYALLNRLSYDFSSDYRLLLVHRYYAHDYWAMFANAFSEGSTPQNENGWYVAAEAAPLAGWRFFFSGDFFSFPWWKYRISKPSQGMEFRFQTTYEPCEELTVYANYRYKRRERDVTGTSGEVTLPTHHHKARFRLSYTTDAWKLQTTADYNVFRQDTFSPQQGWHLTQSCTYVFPWHTLFPLSASLQGTYFDTDDYDSRVYVYERGLLYTFYTPSYSGEGFRYSAILRCDVGKTLMLLFKFGYTHYLDRDEISSGDDLIRSNKKADLQMQFRCKF